MSLKKILFILFLFINVSFSFAYTTTKITKILDDPSGYNGKKVLVYIKFDTKVGDGVFVATTGEGLEFVYDTNNTDISDLVDKFKRNDYVTVKGEVKLHDGFYPKIVVDGLNKEWIDTTLLPPTPDEVEITCPNCGNTFKYDVKNKKVIEK